MTGQAGQNIRSFISLVLKRSDCRSDAEEGVLVREGDDAAIRQCIDIPDYVDFSTGNIHFNGDVNIIKGVRDCFIVKASGTVEVRGLSEAATIYSGKDMVASGGFAGRDRGTAIIGRDRIAKYLDNIRGEIRGDLKSDREVINCELVIHGHVASPHGAIIGGRIMVTGRVEVATIGSAGNVPTEVVIGSVPTLEAMADKLSDMISTYTESKQKFLEEQDMINKLTGNNRATATYKERQAELMFELSTIDTALNKAQPALDNLNQKINQQRTVDVTISRKLFGKATFCYRNQRYTVIDEVRGPLHIQLDSTKSLAYRQGEAQAKLLSEICEVSTVTP
jgi:uncharacterized protein (DUF342 family)